MEPQNFKQRYSFRTPENEKEEIISLKVENPNVVNVSMILSNHKNYIEIILTPSEANELITKLSEVLLDQKVHLSDNQESVNLSLTPKEAQAIREVCGSVGGDSSLTQRKYIDSVGLKLSDLGFYVTYDNHEDDQLLSGTIYFHR